MSGIGTRSQPLSDSPPPQQSPPSTHELVLTLEELYSGATKRLKVTRHRHDPSTGARKEDSKIVQLNVVPGWKAGTKVTFAGDGDELPGCTPGDLVFIIAEKKHEQFQREGNDIVYVHTLALKDSLTAPTITVPTLDKSRPTIKVDVSQDALSPDYVKQVKGAGMPSSKRPGEHGDLLIRFDIRFPSRKLSPQQQQTLSSIL